MSLSTEFDSIAGVFAAAVENADALITVTDEHGVIEYVNPAFSDVLGHDLEAAKGKDIDFLYAENGVDDKLNEIWAAIKEGTRWRGELKTKTLSGDPVWCRTTVSPVINEMGSLTHCVWVQLDITEQKLLERKQQHSDKRLHSILDNIPAYVFSKNRDGLYTYANKMLAMLHARPVEDIIGKSDYDLFEKQAAKVFTRNDDQVFSTGRTIRALENAGIDEYGIERSYLSVKCPIMDEDDQVEELLGMSVDISEQQRLERALRESEEKLNSILDNMKARVYIKDADLKYTYANEELCNLLGIDRVNIIGKDDYDLFELETAIGFRATDQKVFETKRKVDGLEMSIEPDTKEKRFYWSVKVPLMTSEGEVHSLLGISTDVTEQKRLEEELRRKESQLTTILDNLKAHVYIKDVNYHYTYVNADMCEYLGMDKDDIIGKSDTEIFGEKIAERFHKSDNQVFNYKENSSSIEKSRHFRTKKKRYFWSVKVPLINDLGNSYALLGISTDVTEQKRLEKELRELASTDVLTGVNNRRHFIDLCEREIKRAKRYENPLSLIMLDIDHFKNINDTHGHAVGDEAIRVMTKLCIDSLRDTDVIGRIGGEEFAIILPMTDITGAWQIAQRIRQAAENHSFKIDDETLCEFTSSFGVTELKDGDTNPDDLLKRADIALYAAKSQGRNRVCESES
ncbi:sensor domain-containing diguanylate cyclase [Terasakiella sp. A23]|uniref:sensor domain-containing diguanylate cyclase n=1 Tax=Terasakiella sp. FCG-A23 TaxID=3080561 RepID=UPI0029546DEA|nr:sensor domain-containing diguanylate cyclase [Terasakiella sp. A23]MDV7339826.1 sensor domain-containing diguanylate cyclase [Terasakiella sp. A23]